MRKTSYASLDAGLLARKGRAAPAFANHQAIAGHRSLADLATGIRPAPEPRPDPDPRPQVPAHNPVPMSAQLEGRRQAGPTSDPAQEAKPVQMEPEIDAPERAFSPKPKSGRLEHNPNGPHRPRSGRFKTTVRLTGPQRKRLRLAARFLDMSQQRLLCEALDLYLDRMAGGASPDEPGRTAPPESG